MSKLLTVEVIKSRWHRGHGLNSGLRMPNGNQCCIGFVARKLGVGIKDIKNAEMMGDVEHPTCEKFHNDYRDILDEAYAANDNSELSDGERIKQLKVIGQKMGIRFVFKP